MNDTTPATLSAEQLDELYSSLCATLSRVGEAQASLYLGRFALLAMLRVADATAIRTMIADAAHGLAQ